METNGMHRSQAPQWSDNRTHSVSVSHDFDDDAVAKCFGLETAWLLLDASFRDFQIARYESEKRLIKQRLGGPSTVNFK